MALPHPIPEELETSQQNVSKHLGLLTDAAILTRRKNGTHVHYRIGDREVLGLCDQVCGSVEHQFRELAALVAQPASPYHPQSLE